MPIDDFITHVENPVVNNIYTEAPHYYYTTTTGDVDVGPIGTTEPLAHVGPLDYDRYQQTVSAEAAQVDIASLMPMIDLKIEIAMKEQQQNLYRIISEHCGIDISMDEFIKLLQGK